MAATAQSKHGLLTAKFRVFLQQEGCVGILMDVMDSTLNLNIEDRSMFKRWDILDFGDGGSDYQIQPFYDYSQFGYVYYPATSDPVYIKYRLTWADDYISEATTGPHYMFPSKVKS